MNRSTEDEANPGAPFSRYEAHPFRPHPAPEKALVCALCGEPANQIRHHPRRIAAACLLRGVDPASVLGNRGEY